MGKYQRVHQHTVPVHFYAAVLRRKEQFRRLAESQQLQDGLCCIDIGDNYSRSLRFIGGSWLERTPVHLHARDVPARTIF